MVKQLNPEQKAAHVKACIKYNAKNLKQIKFNLNYNNPDDVRIIEYLGKSTNVQGLIKTSIKEHMEREHYELRKIQGSDAPQAIHGDESPV